MPPLRKEGAMWRTPSYKIEHNDTYIGVSVNTDDCQANVIVGREYAEVTFVTPAKKYSTLHRFIIFPEAHKIYLSGDRDVGATSKSSIGRVLKLLNAVAKEAAGNMKDPWFLRQAMGKLTLEVIDKL